VLGASTIVIGPPAALAAATWAWMRGTRGPWAVAALTLGGIEALVLATLLALAFSGFAGG